MTDSAYDDTSQCPDGGRCSHACGQSGACYRVLHCSPLTSYGEDWSDEVNELHVLRYEYDELRNEFFVVAPFEVAFRSAQRKIGELEAELDDAASLNEELEYEIARHHKDFKRWEAMADKGAAKIERARAIDILLPVAEQWLDAFSDDELMSWTENLRYTKVRDTVATLRGEAIP